MRFSESTSSEMLLNYFGFYHFSRLKSHNETMGMATKFEKVQKKLEDKFKTRVKIEQEILLIEGKLAQAEIELSFSIRNLKRDLEKKVLGNRKDILYLKYFPKGLKPFSRKLTEKQIGDIKKICINAKEEDPDYWISEDREDLENKFSIWEGFLQEKSDHDIKHIEAFSQEKALKLEWKEVYLTNRLELMTLFKRNRRVVQSFFKHLKRKRKENNSIENFDKSDSN